MVKLLSERVQELESANDDMCTRLELLESYGTPESPPKILDSNSTTAKVCQLRTASMKKIVIEIKKIGTTVIRGAISIRPKRVQCTSERSQYPARLRISEVN